MCAFAGGGSEEGGGGGGGERIGIVEEKVAEVVGVWDWFGDYY